MYIVKIAWNNLLRNKLRTTKMILFICIVVVALLVFDAYMQYIADGMQQGYISMSGDFQIAGKDYWDKKDAGCILHSDDLEKIRAFLTSEDSVKDFECVLEFQGLVGNDFSSFPFIGIALDNPSKYYKASVGSEIEQGNAEALLGIKLAEKLGVMFKDGNQYVNIMSSSFGELSFSSVEVVGGYQLGTNEIDSMLLVTSRDSALDLFSKDDSASYLQVFLKDKKYFEKFLSAFKKDLSVIYEIKSWRDLNPMYEEINKLYKSLYYIASLILCILIYVSLTQSLSSSFNERLSEYGTLEAIGLRKSKISLMIILEGVMCSLIAIFFGVFFSIVIKHGLSMSGATFTPPGHNEGYPVILIFKAKNILLNTLFVFLTCIFSMIGPLVNVLRNSVKTLLMRS